MTIDATMPTASVVSSVPGPCSTGQRWCTVEKYESTQADSHTLGTGDGGAPLAPPSDCEATARRTDCRAAHVAELLRSPWPRRCCCRPAVEDVVEAAGEAHDGIPAKTLMTARLGVVPELSVKGGETGAETSPGPRPPAGEMRARFGGGDDPATPGAAESRRP